MPDGWRQLMGSPLYSDLGLFSSRVTGPTRRICLGRACASDFDNSPNPVPNTGMEGASSKGERTLQGLLHVRPGAKGAVRPWFW